MDKSLAYINRNITSLQTNLDEYRGEIASYEDFSPEAKKLVTEYERRVTEFSKHSFQDMVGGEVIKNVCIYTTTVETLSTLKSIVQESTESTLLKAMVLNKAMQKHIDVVNAKLVEAKIAVPKFEPLTLVTTVKSKSALAKRQHLVNNMREIDAMREWFESKADNVTKVPSKVLKAAGKEAGLDIRPSKKEETRLM